MGDLSISYEREQVVDFSMPFLDLGEGVKGQNRARPHPRFKN